MFFKQKLVDQSVYIKKIPSSFLSIDYKKIEKEAMDSVKKKLTLNNNSFSPYKNYYTAKDNIHHIWVTDFVRDFFKIGLYEKATLVPHSTSYIVLNRGDDISSHNHIDEYNIQGSPDFTALLPIKSAENQFLEIEYGHGRKRQMKQRVPLIPEEVILFNAELNHRFLINKEFQTTIILCSQMKLI